MDSQPITVPPSGEHSSSRRTQSMSHPPNVGSLAGDVLKTMTPPGTGRSSAVLEEKLIRRGSSQVQPVLIKPISKESLMANSSTWADSPAPPLSPGLGGVFPTTGESSPKADASEKMNESGCKLTRKESYKAQRKNYRMEKKRVAEELLSSLKDPTVVVMSDWLKVRGTLKSWTKLWCILKPGLLLLYKSPKIKSNHWVGTVLLNTCQVIERPSKKDGFCFKLFHPLEQSIWLPRGPEKEAIGAVVQPLPTSYLIFRAPSQAAGKCWLDALELSLRCSSLIVRSTSVIPRSPQHDSTLTTHETQWSEADYEKHFEGHDPLLSRRGRRARADLEDTVSQSAENGMAADAEISPTDSESDDEEHNKEDDDAELQQPINETPYVAQENEVFGMAGEVVAELQEEQKSLIWFLIKQVRPGMDLSKVVLPTFILEPRSFLEKLADSYYHVDLLSQAVLEDDAFTRMKAVIKWYLSGFYKKPQGLKKPYNSLLGETFRCYWQHPNGSRTFYLAEQVSHHPPISGFYVTNRQDGFTISGSIIAKSKFYGNSTSAILDGTAVLTMLPRGEDYTMTIPYAHCKGILMGTLSMELGGKINIVCEKTGYNCELEFKLKPFLGGADQLNMVSGRIKLGKETLANISGYWDGQIMITDKRTGQESVFFNPTPDVRKTRLKKYTVPLENQGDWESEKLWLEVSKAINNDDQTMATEAKTALEEAQRERAKERKALGQEWIPKHFVQDIITGNWVYRHADIRPWDSRNDVVQYEHDYIISTKTRHKTPIMRTGSIVSMEPQSQVPLLLAESRSSLSVLKSSKRQLTNNHPESTEAAHDSASSSDAAHSDSSQSVGKRRRSIARVTNMVKHVEERLHQHSEKLDNIQRLLEQSSVRQRAARDRLSGGRLTKHLTDTLIVVLVVFIAQFIMRFWSSNSVKAADL
ncbi:oxysterol-binding protein-related protein 8 isoform X2 [Copidosoma floridanum]|uniref:oxysterol-binding protein-related protein 8 isoform X2 n=1 Tax=Copidosoma floridanum TaxID=29053 RepID=UPI0006C9ABA1|nr:oxysterol-binding protein-related protein 8 isoform X2 [Copidosoma floridanum]